MVAIVALPWPFGARSWKTIEQAMEMKLKIFIGEAE
jgi:hypothetical protein